MTSQNDNNDLYQALAHEMDKKTMERRTTDISIHRVIIFHWFHSLLRYSFKISSCEHAIALNLPAAHFYSLFCLFVSCFSWFNRCCGDLITSHPFVVTFGKKILKSNDKNNHFSLHPQTSAASLRINCARLLLQQYKLDILT